MRNPPEKLKPGRPVDLPEWAQWKGEGPMPAHWHAVNPADNTTHKVYRSYEDYCSD